MAYFDDVNFIHAAHLPNCTAHVDRVFEDLYGVMLLFSGSIELSLDHGSVETIHGPTVFWHEMGRHYEYYPTADSWHHLWVSFHGPRAERLIKQGFNPINPTLHAAQLVEVEEAYKTMVELVKIVLSDLTRKHDRAVHLLERMLLITLENQAMDPTDTDARLYQLADRIREEPAHEYDFMQEALQMDLSYSHFRAKFKKLLDIAPHNYLLQCRMGLAASMLQQDHYAIKDIAAHLGYADMAQFSKLFKSRYGYSPRKFRAMGLS